jgi:hypothetical protein
MGSTPKIVNLNFKFIVFFLDALWNALPVFFKQILSSSYGIPDKRGQREPN